MTRKHFVELAKALHAMQPFSGGFHKLADWDVAMTVWSKSVRAIADVCSDSNEHFNLARFIAACENGTKKV